MKKFFKNFILTTIICLTILLTGCTNNKNNENKNMYSVDEIISYENNMFKYTDISISEYDENFGSIIIFVQNIKNISDTELNPNIRIKFYDENKVEMIDYQYRDLSTELNPYTSLKPNESGNQSFTLYDERVDFLLDNISLKDIKYFSIEDIK